MSDRARLSLADERPQPGDTVEIAPGEVVEVWYVDDLAGEWLPLRDAQEGDPEGIAFALGFLPDYLYVTRASGRSIYR